MNIIPPFGIHLTVDSNNLFKYETTSGLPSNAGKSKSLRAFRKKSQILTLQKYRSVLLSSNSKQGHFPTILSSQKVWGSVTF